MGCPLVCKVACGGNFCIVDLIEVVEAVFVLFFAECIDAICGHGDVVATEERARRGVPGTHIRMQACRNNPIHAETSKMGVETGLVESIVKALLEHVVTVFDGEFGDDFGPFGAFHGVFTPHFEFGILWAVGVVGVNDPHVMLAGCWKKVVAEWWDDGLGTLGGDCAGHEVVHHVEDEDSIGHIVPLVSDESRR